MLDPHPGFVSIHVHVAEPPRITTHPQELKEAVQWKPAKLSIQTTGTEPLSYQWEWKPAKESVMWQSCRAEWCDGATLTIHNVQKSNEGSYCCVITVLVVRLPIQLNLALVRLTSTVRMIH